MKKILMITLTILISVAFVTTVFAQAPKPADKPAAAAPEKPMKADMPMKAAKPAKAKAMTFKGDFVSGDAAAKTIVAKGEKGEMTFDVSGIKKVPELKAGDKVTVTYKEKDGKNMASAVKKAKAAKPKTEKKPAEPKPAEPAKK